MNICFGIETWSTEDRIIRDQYVIQGKSLLTFGLDEGEGNHVLSMIKDDLHGARYRGGA